MKALVTGGSGCLGRRLTARLLERGDTVRLFDSRPPDPPAPPSVDLIRGDVRDADALARAAEGMDVVFHLVGIMPQARVPDSLLRGVNLEGTRNALGAARKGGAQRFVFLSSSEVYGRPPVTPIAEEGPCRPHGLYGALKLEAEALCAGSGIAWSAIRPSTLVGSGLTDPLLLDLLRRVKGQSILAVLDDGSSRFQMSSLRDTVEACLLAADRPEAVGRVFNIGADDVPTFGEFLSQVRERLGYRGRVLRLPSWLVRGAFRALDAVGRSPLPPDHYRLLDITMIMDCSKAKRLLGWKPTQTNIEMVEEAFRDAFPESAGPRPPASEVLPMAQSDPAAPPLFGIEYFARIQATLEADPEFLRSLQGIEAELGIEGPGGKRFVVTLHDAKIRIDERADPCEAGVAISEAGWQALTSGTNPARLLITRKIKLLGKVMKYSRHMGPLVKVLDLIQGKRPLLEPTAKAPGAEPATRAPAPSPAPPAPAPAEVDEMALKPRSRMLVESDGGVPTGIVRLAILRGAGIDPQALARKPVIGIANTWTETTAGHVHLRDLARHVHDGVIEAGGIPLEFNTLGPCDAYGNGNLGMRYILAQRDIIADSIEAFARAHWFDGLVTLSSCDKSNPGVLMALARLDIPALCITGGPNMMNARNRRGYRGLDHKVYDDVSMKLETTTCATCGSCELATTANTVQSLMEALGMTMPGTATIPAFMTDKVFAARAAGRRVVEMIREDLRPSKILTREAFENAIMVDMAIGGSTNAALHLPAVAHEAGVDLPLDLFNHFAKKIPTLVGLAPSGPYGVMDLHQAGGVPAVMKRLKDDLHLGAMTVLGQTLGDVVRSAPLYDEAVIPPKEHPFLPEGGTVVLKGNLAPDGSVVKQSAVHLSMLQFTGRARVFDGEAQALKALQEDSIEPGSVLVIRYEGPKGAPGMPEMLSVTMMLDAMQMKDVALVTDGRFSGASQGPCIGHVSPEAYAGGPIGLLRDGDRISIDIPNRSLNVEVSDREIRARRDGFRRLERPIPPGYLRRYQRLVSSAHLGAVLL